MLSNIYQSLQDESNDIAANSLYRNFKSAFATEEVIPTRWKAKQKVPQKTCFIKEQISKWLCTNETLTPQKRTVIVFELHKPN